MVYDLKEAQIKGKHLLTCFCEPNILILIFLEVRIWASAPIFQIKITQIWQILQLLLSLIQQIKERSSKRLKVSRPKTNINLFTWWINKWFNYKCNIFYINRKKDNTIVMFVVILWIISAQKRLKRLVIMGNIHLQKILKVEKENWVISSRQFVTLRMNIPGP